MRSRRGFTIVELVVVLAVMAILLALTIAGITKSQQASRDRQRQADVEQLARGFEQRYVTGNPEIQQTASDGSNYATAGSYPGVYEFQHMMGADQTALGYIPVQLPKYVEENLPGTTIDSRTAPGGTAGDALIIYAGATPENTTYLNSASGVTKDTYMYEPLTASGTLCNTGPCVRFNLYYRRESDGQLVTIRSKHQ